MILRVACMKVILVWACSAIGVLASTQQEQALISKLE